MKTITHIHPDVFFCEKDVYYMCVKFKDDIHYGENYVHKMTNSHIFNSEQCVYYLKLSKSWFYHF
uniref:Uncharacterized protein n=1 Tax=Aegilops tauschii subsp. strangulata TaxID=200361 RepID=A0A453KYH9_AEGTS